ncbi:MAG: TlpA disulfide reductase family protein [Tepidisphaeraceae bacterium]
MTSTFLRRAAMTCVAALVVALSVAGQEQFTLKWQECDIHAKGTGYRPHAIALSPKAPEGLKKAPVDLAAPQYGSFKVGAATYLVIVDEVDGKPAKLFVDGHHNGDLTEEEPHAWTEKRFPLPEGGERVNYNSDATIQIPFASGPKNGHLKFYRVEGKAPNGRPMNKTVFFYSDYGLAGEVKVAGKTVSAVLEDSGCTGDFSVSGPAVQTPLIWLDLNGDGKPGRGESFPVTRPFEFDGKWWALANITPEGSFKIVESTKPVAASRPAGPDLSPGQKAPAFTARLLGGKPVKFPEDYKGKVVLLDFWATWCGPCIAELPNVVNAYEKYHPEGLEILGISLDREGAEQKLADFTRQKKMPWQQVYDGKFWQAEVARTYGIHAIPHMLLVDGDTGVIIADTDIRGDKLAPTIEKALAGKKK